MTNVALLQCVATGETENETTWITRNIYRDCSNDDSCKILLEMANKWFLVIH